MYLFSVPFTDSSRQILETNAIRASLWNLDARIHLVFNAKLHRNAAFKRTRVIPFAISFGYDEYRVSLKYFSRARN